MKYGVVNFRLFIGFLRDHMEYALMLYYIHDPSFYTILSSLFRTKIINIYFGLIFCLVNYQIMYLNLNLIYLSFFELLSLKKTI